MTQDVQTGSPQQLDNAATSRFAGFVGRLISDGLLIGASTALGYMLALNYETAYCAFFGVPAFLVSPTLPQIAASVGLVVTLVVGVVVIGGQFAARIKTHAIRQNIFLAGGVASLLGIGLVWVPGARQIGFALFLIAAIAVNLVSLSGIVSTRGMNERTLLVVGALGLVMLVSGVPLMSRVLGHNAAAVERVFYSLADQRDVIIVRNYGDVLVGVRFDRAKRVLLSETVVIRTDPTAKTRLYREELGRLAGYEQTIFWLK